MAHSLVETPAICSRLFLQGHTPSEDPSISTAEVKNGLPRDVSLRLAAQTVLGAAKMTQADKPGAPEGWGGGGVGGWIVHGP